MLEDTGERVIPELMDPMNNLLLEHISRYQFAMSYLHGRVLDLSCGSGYGTHLMVKKKKREVQEVVGVDIDAEIIHYAKGKYYHPKSNFLVADATSESLVNDLGTFDVIVSFETIEHIEDEERLLNNYYELLKPNGTLIVSTPFGKGRGVPCGSPFHVHQLRPDEFYALFTRYSNTSFFLQDGVLIEPYPGRKDVYYPLGIAVCRK
ncbi:class I SAM-dependent methyltransferase [Salirhabdus salicampi]|uniref:class I SAM-dependent methyltransferase n=1 Tax=Salirhabdus salicampi TaxID=476102 RepID=UPI0020C24337|nr:class I SAM-dependent methyltransferase [Salirhabdus salicampi]MCP8618100.1 class I SAM-dependent methyltransferase [Salirhabdus salicampi]